MRKPSEIIALAVADKHYDPMNSCIHSGKYAYLCNLINHLEISGEITLEEYRGAVHAIIEALCGHHTLSNYLGHRLKAFEINRAQYMHFWDQLIQKLQIQGR
jgi:hypothetical protein